LLHPPDDDVIAALHELIEEMERRYRLFEKARADHLSGYVTKTGEPLPRIVCVCDEYADLIMASRKSREELETAVMRLGQKARAAGIHLILATQRPSRTVVTGVLKANMPCRVALRVAEALESRIILDRKGAENLLGWGDLLFSTGAEPLRLQSPYLDEQERRRVFAAVASRGE
jgi:DNA segregation ATPase FtsK/SpoIIIE-like protein